MELQEYIGEIVKKRREELGINKIELERRTRISRMQLLNIENGKSTSTRLLSMLFKELGLEITLKIKD